MESGHFQNILKKGVGFQNIWKIGTIFQNILKNYPPGAAFGGAPGRFAPWGGGFFEPVSKKSAPGDLGRGIFEPGSIDCPENLGYNPGLH